MSAGCVHKPELHITLSMSACALCMWVAAESPLTGMLRGAQRLTAHFKSRSTSTASTKTSYADGGPGNPQHRAVSICGCPTKVFAATSQVVLRCCTWGCHMEKNITGTIGTPCPPELHNQLLAEWPVRCKELQSIHPALRMHPPA